MNQAEADLGYSSLLLTGPCTASVPRKTPGRPRYPAGAARHIARLPEKPVAPRTPPPISNRLKPRLATALFRRYLRACIPTGPDHTSPLTGARPEAVLTESQRVGQRHHH
ncbi:hypothetical protein GA0115233_103634 [Streptomyces sp. DI166]|jgi:hypothetical protein|uniref:hypothetical protein n=1 Tax=Streptomyces sp. DI166 TaxID=1839783 RepID=UPI0007F49C0B|nr:hypothetical protein [Streptomyces sp. DI166]SBT91847.1 hypothetical protein GA0115233_103634 [Streptomyces sp. DI166]